MTDRNHTPLLDALIHHSDSNPVSYHVPGHRYGQALSDADRIEKQWYSTIMKIDVTELSATDDLHHPEGPIAEAQHLAAQCFGAEETFFLVGGSTSGNIALLLAVCEPDDIIIVQRNVHKSVINGLMLAGAKVAFIMPEIDDRTGVATVPSLDTVVQAVHQYPEAKAVFLTNPNYYGMSVDLELYVEKIHSHGLLLLVDEAHGAHYGLHPALPQSAIQAGADAVVQSTHKTLTAMTMGAMLHIQGERMPRESLRQALAAIQSSSPSFPIMASLDISRAMIDRHGAEWFEAGLSAANKLRRWVYEESTVLQTIHSEDDSNAYDQMDALRVVLWNHTEVLTGFELQKHMEERGCWIEMADARHVVLIIGIQTSETDIDKLIAVCQEIELVILNSKRVIESKSLLLPTPTKLQKVSHETILLRRKANIEGILRVALSEAVNETSAEMVIPYPPGIPIVYPGERLSAELVDRIRQLSSLGARFQGAVDSTMQTIAVYQRESVL